MSIDHIRETIIRAAGEVPSAGPDYIERINRIRRWMLDLADVMVPIHLSVNEHGMDINGSVIERTIKLARDVTTSAYSPAHDDVRGALNMLSTGVAEAFHYEEVAEYSATFSASRSALQAIHSAVTGANDYDVFSLAAKATLVAEQAALAVAYGNLAAENDATPSTQQVSKALVSARREIGMAFLFGLNTRIYDDVRRPSYLEQAPELRP